MKTGTKKDFGERMDTLRFFSFNLRVFIQGA